MRRESPLLLRLVLSLLSAAASALLAALVHRLLLREDGGGDGHLAAARALATAAPAAPDAAALDAVGGHAAVKAELRRSVVLPLRHPAVFFGGPRALRPPRGVLLHGPPGTGKTMLARAAARASGAALLALSAAALENKWWGETPKLLEAAFRVARDELAPCVLFLDEVDGLGRARSDADQACVYSLKCELLRQLDALGGDGDRPPAAVVVVACTNCPDALDPALRRRLGRALLVPPPTAAERADILRALLAEGGAEGGAEGAATLARVAAAAEGFTGADLAALLERASARRMDPARVERALAGGGVADGAALARRLGPLAWRHWAAAAEGDPRWRAPAAAAAGGASRRPPP